MSTKTTKPITKKDAKKRITRASRITLKDAAAKLYATIIHRRLLAQTEEELKARLMPHVAPDSSRWFGSYEVSRIHIGSRHIEAYDGAPYDVLHVDFSPRT